MLSSRQKCLRNDQKEKQALGALTAAEKKKKGERSEEVNGAAPGDFQNCDLKIEGRDPEGIRRS